MAEYAVVYVPLSYALTGVMYLYQKKNKLINNVSSAEVMKFAVSGGVSEWSNFNNRHLFFMASPVVSPLVRLEH
jgi:hypothetical protein